MWLRKKSPIGDITGFLDRDTSVTGEMQFSGWLRIDGRFHGSISTADTLVVGEHGELHADIKAGQIEIYGKVFGNIDARRRVEIHPTGRVRGDIRCPVLVIEAGGTFDGRTRMEAVDNASESDSRDLRIDREA